jgi:hypothetical protein
MPRAEMVSVCSVGSKCFAARVPQLFCDRCGIEPSACPPGEFVAIAMDLAMMDTAEWDRVLITDLATQRARLGKTEVVSIRGQAAADHAWLHGDELQV